MPAVRKDRKIGRPANYAVKLGMTTVLLILIFRQVDPARAWQAVSQVSPARILLAMILQLASNCVATFRWSLIMARIGFRRPFSFYLKSFFKGAFFNQGLPTSIGGDGIRILDCSREKGTAEDAFYGVFIDRIVGLAGLLLLNICALLFNRRLLPPSVYYPLLLILVALFSGLILLFFLRRFRFITTSRILGYLGRLSERYFQVYSTLGSIALQTGLSVLNHLLAMTAFYVLGISIGLDYPIQVYLALVPPVILLTILPISLAGWGVREGAMVGFFLLIGADKSRVLSFSILYGLLALACSLPGLVVYLGERKTGRQAEQPQHRYHHER